MHKPNSPHVAHARQTLTLLLFIAVASMVSGSAHADLIHIQYSSDNNSATGDINGTSFSGANWKLEYDFEDSTGDSSTSADQGRFLNSIVSGRIEVDGSLYELTGPSISGQVALRQSSTGNYLQLNPSSGGFMQFITGTNTIFPTLFTDPNSLASAVDGGTLSNSTTDAFNNQSVISFQRSTFEPDFSSHLVAENGDSISISNNGGAATGNITVSISRTQQLGVVAVPEPSSAIVLGCGLAILGLRRRKR